MKNKDIIYNGLKKYFGFDTFKGNQEAIINSILSGKDTFVLMPTGGGKSLCYQLPALLMEGTAIIISPLIALMKNQVDAMRSYSEKDGIAHFLNSSLTKAEIEEVKKDIISGKTKMLYVAPESLTKQENIEFLRSVPISFYAVDEAHCISEWGHDFRPEYRRIRPIINEISPRPIIALTATATPKVQHDIQKTLGMTNAEVFKSSFNRPNLNYEVRKKTDQIDKEIIKYILSQGRKSGIVYCLSRKKVDDFAEILQANNIRALPYHAGMDGGIQTAKMGHDVIMTPTTYAYFDYYQAQNSAEEPFGIGGFLPVEQVYRFEPAPDILTEEEKKHILGPQANLWTEYIKESWHVEYMVLPRLAAMSEVQWMQPENKNYENFLERLPRLIKQYEKLGYTYATHVFDVQGEFTPNFESNKLDITFSTIDDADVYYTLDGSDPSESSTLYDGTFSIDEDAEIKAVAIRNGVKSKILCEVISISKSTYKPVELLSTPARSYEYSGAPMLVDGLKGKNTNYRTGRWLGFQGDDLVAIIDMQEPTEISSIEVNNAVVTGDWIFDSSEIIVESSDDKRNFSSIITEKISDQKSEHWSDISTHNFSFDPVTARYYRITIKPTVMPEWHPGSGRRAFIFVDEISLN
jgi:hypothetical protein